MTQARDARVVSLYPDKPIPPPSGYSPRKKRLWREIVGAFAVDFFRPSDRRVLVAYVDALALHEDMTQAIERDGAVLTDANGRKYANPAAAIVNQCAARIATLGAKLRIHPASRMRSEDAHALANQRPSSIRPPWEMRDEDEVSERYFDGKRNSAAVLEREAAKRGKGRTDHDDD